MLIDDKHFNVKTMKFLNLIDFHLVHRSCNIVMNAGRYGYLNFSRSLHANQIGVSNHKDDLSK